MRKKSGPGCKKVLDAFGSDWGASCPWLEAQVMLTGLRPDSTGKECCASDMHSTRSYKVVSRPCITIIARRTSIIRGPEGQLGCGKIHAGTMLCSEPFFVTVHKPGTSSTRILLHQYSTEGFWRSAAFGRVRRKRGQNSSGPLARVYWVCGLGSLIQCFDGFWGRGLGRMDVWTSAA